MNNEYFEDISIENIRLRSKLRNIENAFKWGILLLCKDFQCPENSHTDCEDFQKDMICNKSDDSQNEIAQKCWQDYLMGGIYEYENNDS